MVKLAASGCQYVCATYFSPNFSSSHNVFVLGEGNLCSRVSSTSPSLSLCQQALLTLHQRPAR